MNELAQWIAQERGRQKQLALSLGIKPPGVAAWLSGKKPVPFIHGAAIERVTAGAVTRKQLFPGEWQRIWPELADSEPKTAIPSVERSSSATENVAPANHPTATLAA